MNPDSTLAATQTCPKDGVHLYPQPPRYAIGDRLDNVSEFDELVSQPTLILFVNSECRFCTESMPFYRRLLADRRPGGSDLSVVAVARPEPVNDFETPEFWI